MPKFWINLENTRAKSGIIYCSTRKNVDNVYLMLRKNALLRRAIMRVWTMIPAKKARRILSTTGRR